MERTCTALPKIIIAKHRNGAVGDVRLRFVGEYTRFQNPDDDLIIPPPDLGGGVNISSRMNAPVSRSSTPPPLTADDLPPMSDNPLGDEPAGPMPF